MDELQFDWDTWFNRGTNAALRDMFFEHIMEHVAYENEMFKQKIKWVQCN